MYNSKNLFNIVFQILKPSSHQAETLTDDVFTTFCFNGVITNSDEFRLVVCLYQIKYA